MRFVSLLIVSLFIPLTLYSWTVPTIRSLHIEGNNTFTANDLLSRITLQPGMQMSSLQLSRDLQMLSDFYAGHGYYGSEIRIDKLSFTPDSSSIDITIAIEEGRQLSIGNIEITRTSVFPREEILRRFETRIGGILVRETLERDIADLLGAYEHQGHPFATAQVQQISIDSTTTDLQIVISIDEGLRTTIDEIRVSGNKETHDNVIVRETRIALHEVYNPEKIARIAPRLNRMNIFSRVEEPQLYVSDNGSGLLINVQEGSTNTFDGIIGYAPGGGKGDDGVVTGFVNISMRNVFGTGRKLHVRWQRDERDAQEVSVGYVEPWVFNFPINLSLGFNQRQQDSVYVQRGIEAAADVLITESLSLGATLTLENVIPSGTILAPVVAKSQTTRAGVTINYDTRDDIVSPTSGVHYRSGYQLGSKEIDVVALGVANAGDRSTIRKLSVDAEMYFGTFERQVLAIGLHGREHTGDHLELGDVYRLGGTNSLRGYRENQFLGSRIAWTNTEYRFLLSRRSFFYGFFDSGYLFLPGDDAKGMSSLQQTKYGYGIGIRLETSVGNIGVSLAFGDGDSFTEGKIHFGLINEF